MILITGGTGTSGREIVEAVGRRGGKMRVMVRDAKKGEAARRMGAEVVVGDLEDREALARACAGVEVALVHSGPTEDLVELQTNIVEAARGAGVRRVVTFSVVGAERAEWRTRMRFVEQHGRVEEAIRGSGMKWTMLRPTFFMSNLLGVAGTVKGAGAIYMPAGEGKAAYVDTKDIAAVAAEALVGMGHEGKGYELTGPEDLGFGDMARVIGREIGKEVKYVAVNDDAARESMLGAGVPAWNVEGVIELMKSQREGVMAGVLGDVEKVTGRKARGFGEWVRENRGAFV